MNKTKTLILSFAVAVAFLLSAPAVFAANCQPVYGGGQICSQNVNLSVNKKVQNPQNNSFVDNLGVTDPHYAPNQNVSFEITITNNGDSTTDVTLNDLLPQFTTLSDGSTTMQVKDLKPAESRKLMLVARTVDGSQLPNAVTCVINQVIATGNGQSTQDSAQFCIEKTGQPVQVTTTQGGLKVFPVTKAQKTPPTGPEAFALFALIPSGIAGFVLRKKTK